jgi:hypothetical protein
LKIKKPEEKLKTTIVVAYKHSPAKKDKEGDGKKGEKEEEKKDD